MPRLLESRGRFGIDGKYFNKTHVEFDNNSLILNQKIQADSNDEAGEGLLAQLMRLGEVNSSPDLAYALTV